VSGGRVAKLLERLGVTEFMLYKDIGKDVLPTATETRYPAPSSTPAPNLVLNFPVKAERLSKTSYGNQRAAITAAEADAARRTVQIAQGGAVASDDVKLRVKVLTRADLLKPEEIKLKFKRPTFQSHDSSRPSRPPVD
jgi:hypothetical protein